MNKDTQPYVCHQCDTLFSRGHNLESHLATQVYYKLLIKILICPKKKKCTTCNHLFRRQHDLKRHQKLQTGEKRPHLWGRSFARLNRYQRVEMGG